MAHFLAKELHMRPAEILNNWTVEELMVAYGEYANIKAHESYDMMTPKERVKKHMTEYDRWAVMFVPFQDALSVSSENERAEERRQNELDLQEAARLFM